MGSVLLVDVDPYFHMDVLDRRNKVVPDCLEAAAPTGIRSELVMDFWGAVDAHTHGLDGGILRKRPGALDGQ